MNDVKPEEPHTDIVACEPTNDSHSSLLNDCHSHPISPRAGSKAGFLISIKLDEGEASPTQCRTNNIDEEHSYCQNKLPMIEEHCNLKRMKLSGITSLEASEHELNYSTHASIE